MKLFNNPKNLQELREQYKNLCFKYHPDVSGYDSTEAMKQINFEYDEISKLLAKGLKYEESELSFNDLYKEKIEVLMKMKGIIIEIIGNWIWVTGETKTNKDELKKLDFRYAPKKQAWFFKSYAYRKISKREIELDEIRDLYGSTVVSKSSNNTQLGFLS